MSNSNRSHIGSIVSVLVSVMILSLTLWIVLNRQYVFDQWSVSRYQPTAPVSTIAANLGMSEKGRFYFYASQPAINTSTDFNTNCQRQEAKSAILGCYTNSRIYIYDVANSQLEGIEEVTAAHETLHAIWDRMSDNDQKRVGELLEAEYQKINDPALQERMAYYDRTEPGEHQNELHSILGTEITTLSPALEEHYNTYFDERSKVVALFTGYESVFTAQENQAVTMLAELTSLKTDLESSTTQYNSESGSIEADYIALKNSEGSVDRTSAAQVNGYNGRVAALRLRVNKLSTLRSSIVTKQDTYNTKVAAYNALVVNTNELTKSLDSTLSPTPTPVSGL